MDRSEHAQGFALLDEAVTRIAAKICGYTYAFLVNRR
jgi:hypothetical protein